MPEEAQAGFVGVDGDHTSPPPRRASSAAFADSSGAAATACRKTSSSVPGGAPRPAALAVRPRPELLAGLGAAGPIPALASHGPAATKSVHIAGAGSSGPCVSAVQALGAGAVPPGAAAWRGAGASQRGRQGRARICRRGRKSLFAGVARPPPVRAAAPGCPGARPSDGDAPRGSRDCSGL